MFLPSHGTSAPTHVDIPRETLSGELPTPTQRDHGRSEVSLSSTERRLDGGYAGTQHEFDGKDAFGGGLQETCARSTGRFGNTSISTLTSTPTQRLASERGARCCFSIGIDYSFRNGEPQRVSWRGIDIYNRLRRHCPRAFNYRIRSRCRCRLLRAGSHKIGALCGHRGRTSRLRE